MGAYEIGKTKTEIKVTSFSVLNWNPFVITLFKMLKNVIC